MSKQISRNGGATIKVSRKTAHDKVVFFILGPKKHFSQKNCGTMNKVIALNLYIGTNVLVYERRLMVKVCVKKTFSAKIAIFSLKMTQLKIFLCLPQAPNTAMQICRNKGASKKASRKSVYDKVFKVLAKKVTFIKRIVVIKFTKQLDLELD